ncbi:hypothetical protein TVAG_452750 [Trichomonas vaginalis G3]|uniref:Uncharacterized protein n=1 Tax=Trichomonas vaginalis (strain ATCC PRA-98 / G3) TaxID=412133 RepID=A2DJZ6_TRIV3|nr:hypothetical protein TVAGG3_0290980 [Trichomonas vaginalis G3]EAY19360.1 hypothetical protein TVAG_452750 [Trichomonas vaginalis G3]KAI5527268.1 hypothetical protein TVAGG3_0290980 [Trichomonas vaginalis G3]|eukprot:XP_001580346.1 hypothetical protein [Trichomonas vaginalis G3]
MTSFWDLEPEAGSSLESLTEASDPDWKAILEDPELFTTYRLKEQYLITFLTKPSNFDTLLKFVFGNDAKQSKLVLSLFLGQKSELLQQLFSSNENITKLLNLFDASNDKHLGFVSRLITTIIEQNQEIFYQNFDMLTHFPKLVALLHKISIYDTVDKIIFSQETKKQWLIWSMFRIFVPKLTVPKLFEENSKTILSLIEKIKTIKFTMSHRINMMKIVSKFINQNLDNKEITDILHPILPKLLYATENIQLIKLILDLSVTQPPSTHTASFAIEFMQKSPKFTQTSASALRYLAKYPSKQTLVNFQAIFDSFLADKNNTFHHEAFFELIKSGMKIQDFRKVIIEKLPPVILYLAQKEKWRKNLPFVTFLLEIALAIDEFITNNDKWTAFRKNELSLYKTKDDIDISYLLSDAKIDFTKESAIELSMDRSMATESHETSQKEENLKKSEENKTELQPNMEFPAFEESKPEENQQSAPEFPEFEENPSKSATGVKNDENVGFGDQKVEFPAFEEFKPEENQNSAPEFPAFEENAPKPAKSDAKPADNIGFGTGSVEFPTFEENTKSDQNSGETKIEFPSFDEAKPQTQNEEIPTEFPTFGEVSENGDSQPQQLQFPSFDEPQKAEISQQEPKLNSENTQFPSFEEAEQAPKTPFPSTEEKSEEFKKFIEMLNDECWQQHIPDISKLFDTADNLSDPNESFKFIIKAGW